MSVATATATSTVACRSNLFDNNLFFITDGGTIYDNGFNENTYAGANEYVNSIEPGKKAAYITPPSPAPQTLLRYYRAAKIYGAKTAVLSGFRHEELLPESSNLFSRVLINDVKTTPVIKNVAEINYESELSGFSVAIGAIAYDTALNMKKPGSFANNQIVFSGFGGQDNPISVDNYLFGYLVAFSFWNYVKSEGPNGTTGKYYIWLENVVKSLLPSTEKLKLIEFLTAKLNSAQSNGSDGLSERGIYKINSNISTWFSGSFEPGGGVAIVRSLLNNSDEPVNLFFPVVAGQSLDAIDGLKLTEAAGVANGTTKMIGVDTNQGPVLNNNGNHNIVLLSAVKKLKESTNQILKEMNKNPNSVLGKNNNNIAWTGAEGTLPNMSKIKTNEWINNFLTNKNKTLHDSGLLENLEIFWNQDVLNKLSSQANWSSIIKKLGEIDNGNWGQKLANMPPPSKP